MNEQSPGKLEVITGKIIREIFKGNNNFRIYRVTGKTEDFTALGNLPQDERLKDLVVSFTGTWENNAKHGKNFKFVSCSVLDGKTKHFLTRVVKNIGEALADELLNTFGEEELINILDNEPSRLLEVKGIGHKKMRSIKESWDKNRAIKSLTELLAPAGATISAINAVYAHFGDAAVKKIKSNPYAMVDVSGIGFRTADAIAIKLGVALTSVFRLATCISHVMWQIAQDKGDTVVEQRVLISEAKKLLDVPEKGIDIEVSEIEKTVTDLLCEKKLKTVVDDKVAIKTMYHIEESIFDLILARRSQRLKPILEDEQIEKYIQEHERLNQFSYSDNQKAIIRLIGLGNKLVMLCGYAGTGKSTSMKACLELLASKYKKEEMICVALAGIAADRIRSVTGFYAKTIHSALEWNGDEFTYNQKNKAPYKVVVLDESSMVNAPIFLHLLKALSDDAILILVGDDAQLAPIGAGNVFADFLSSGLTPVVKLTQIYRQSSDSVLAEFASEIRQGRVPADYRSKTIKYKDFAFHSCRDNEEIVRAIVAETKRVSPYVKNLVTDIQILAPQRIGELGTDRLNELLQPILNRDFINRGTKMVERFKVIYAPGDKVIHIKNKDMLVIPYAQYAKEGYDSEFAKKTRIYNGTVGIIMEIDPDAEKAFVKYGDLVVCYDFLEVGNILKLAYALSVHKAQGSEYKYVLMPVTRSHWRMMDNKLLYTAITRAANKTALYGMGHVFEHACKNILEIKRNTVLSYLIAKENNLKKAA
ncbi:AAA family ATPase [Geotalea sp. SG265]|uniref:SF1B family DNA helicase RecD2 n=1 Tax=Geotalea sp. SG265 TaxID=2922867 RepID=UPI001FAF3979|nr:AAA family ATPase [Geotalea sp. SG265]